MCFSNERTRFRFNLSHSNDLVDSNAPRSTRVIWLPSRNLIAVYQTEPMRATFSQLFIHGNSAPHPHPPLSVGREIRQLEKKIRTTTEPTGRTQTELNAGYFVHLNGRRQQRQKRDARSNSNGREAEASVHPQQQYNNLYVFLSM